MKIASDNWFASPTILPLQMAQLARLFDERMSQKSI
jgi:hypothetical protein